MVTCKRFVTEGVIDGDSGDADCDEMICARWGEPGEWTLDWIEQCLTSPPTQYRLSGRVLQGKRPNQQYQSTEGKTLQKTEKKQTENTIHRYKTVHIYNTASPPVYTSIMQIY